MSEARLQRFAQAYLAMAEEADYRPQAPSDGCGHIQLSRKELKDPARLRQECIDYALRFDKEEDARVFNIGCSDFRTNRAFLWTIEAARQLAGGHAGNPTA